MKKLTTYQFIERAYKIHGDKYDYSKVKYVNNRTKVCIICPEHGEFMTLPSLFLLGHQCPKCSKYCVKYTTDTWVNNAKDIHGDKYDYSKVEYIDNRTKVCIICPEHGEFWQIPSNHISRKTGCPYCAKVGKLNKNIFLQKAKLIHGDKYDYSKVEYINSTTKVCIICPEHGEFWQTPNSHLNGIGCKKCGINIRIEKRKKTITQFIEDARKIHGDKYDYSKVDYINNHTKICIICPEHGEFWQTPDSHISQKQGCPICKESRLEKKIRCLLLNNNIKFEQQKRFEWLGYQSLDFYLPDYNIAIECQGIQHFEPICFFGGEEGLKETIKRDKQKKEKCEKNNIKLLYYSNKKYNNKIINNNNELLKIIKNDISN